MALRPPARLKRRTREHIIADLGINHVERQVLLAGHTVEKKSHDYGLDLILSTYDPIGMSESGDVFIQVKATDCLRTVRGGQFVTCRIERAHLRAWLAEVMPVILIVYDAPKDRAYWFYVQASYGGTRRFAAVSGSEQLTIRIPAAQVLSPESVDRLRLFRDNINAQTESVVHYE